MKGFRLILIPRKITEKEISNNNIVKYISNVAKLINLADNDNVVKSSVELADMKFGKIIDQQKSNTNEFHQTILETIEDEVKSQFLIFKN